MTERTGKLILAAIIVLFVAFKWQYLSLPCYWDEAYPYSYAIKHQLSNGLSMAPNGMPEHLSTGHPTLFYFLQAAWMKLSGESIFAARMLPLLISVCILLFSYRFAKKFFSAQTAIIAVVLLATRNIFLTQSVFMLPETLLSLFVLLALYYWLSGKTIAYLISASLLVLTKEPALMLIAALCIWQIVKSRKEKQNLLQASKNILFTGAPALTAAIFFLVQKKQMGWYLFPRHLGAMSLNFSEVFFRFRQFFKFVFINEGVIVITLIAVAAIATLLIQKRKIFKDKLILIGTIITFALFFTIFSSMNVYCATRYLLCLFPFLFMFFAHFIQEAWLHHKKSLVPVMTVLLIAGGIQFFSALYFKNHLDTNLGYADRVKVQQEGINWLKSQKMQSQSIYAEFLMMYNLRSAAPGYLKEDEVFLHVSNNASDWKILLISDYEAIQNEAVKSTPKKLTKRFVVNNAWMEIWARE